MEQRLLAAVGDGTPVTHAATAAGIGQATFFRWMVRGEAEQARLDAGQSADPAEGPYWRLWQQVTTARSAVAVNQVAVIRKAAEGGYVVKERTRRYRDPADGQVVTETETDYAPPEWRAAAWLLERSFREFGRTPVEAQAGPGGAGGAGEVPPDVADIARRLQELAERRPAVLPGSGQVVNTVVANGHLNGHGPGG